MADVAARLSHVRKQFANVLAVDDLSLEIPQGKIFGFLGANGAGKSTSLRMLVGILQPDAGTVSVLGEQDSARIKARIGFLPEEKGLYKKMRVLEFITYFGRLKGMSARAARERGRVLLAQFQLADWQQEKCESLSKGMGQKVQILATLIHEPQLLILDEPFSGLDPVNVELVRDTMLAFKRAGHTLIFSTHIMEQAEQICDELALIHRGRKLLAGATQQIRQDAGRSLILDYSGDASVLRELPGVTRINDAGLTAELTLAPDTDPQQILGLLLGKLRIHRFDTRATSLHELFIRTVTAADATATAATTSNPNHAA